MWAHFAVLPVALKATLQSTASLQTQIAERRMRRIRGLGENLFDSCWKKAKSKFVFLALR